MQPKAGGGPPGNRNQHKIMTILRETYRDFPESVKISLLHDLQENRKRVLKKLRRDARKSGKFVVESFWTEANGILAFTIVLA